MLIIIINNNDVILCLFLKLKQDSEDERKNLFIGRAPRRIGLGGNGLRGDDDDNARSIVPLNIKELLLAEQKVLQQMHLSSNPKDSEILRNMLTHDGQSKEAYS